MEENKKSSTGLDENIAGALCYLVTWITGIIFLVIEKESKFVRFHAMQSLVLFLALFVISVVFGWIPILGWLLLILLFFFGVAVWAFMMFKAYKGEMYKLPIVGDFAEKQINK